MNGNAPYWSATGSQVELTKKCNPKARIAGKLLTISAIASPNSSARIEIARTNVAALKIRAQNRRTCTGAFACARRAAETLSRATLLAIELSNSDKRYSSFRIVDYPPRASWRDFSGISVPLIIRIDCFGNVTQAGNRNEPANLGRNSGALDSCGRRPAYQGVRIRSNPPM